MSIQLQKQWEMCQEGVRICERNPKVRNKVLEWLQKGQDQWDATWWEILKGYRVANWELLMSAEKFPRVLETTGWWRGLITSSPFSLIPRFLDEISGSDTLGKTL